MPTSPAARAVPLRPELLRAVADVPRTAAPAVAAGLDHIVTRCAAGDVPAVGRRELAAMAGALRARGGGIPCP